MQILKHGGMLGLENAPFPIIHTAILELHPYTFHIHFPQYNVKYTLLCIVVDYHSFSCVFNVLRMILRCLLVMGFAKETMSIFIVAAGSLQES